MKLPDSANEEVRNAAERLQVATEQFIQKWAPENQRGEFAEDLGGLSTVITNFMIAGLKQVGSL